MQKLTLSNFQVFALTSTSFLPLLFWVYPRTAVEMAGIDGQWAVLGICIVGMAVALIHGLLNRRFPDVSGADMPPLALGNWVGKTMALLYFPGYAMFVAVSLYAFVQTLKPFLTDTPNFAIAVGLVVISMIGASYGVETLARTASFSYPLVTLVLFVVFGYIVSQGAWTGAFPRPVSLVNSMHGIYYLMPIFFGVNLFLMLSPYYKHRQKVDIWIPVISLAIASIVIILVYLGVICFIGYEGIKELTQPPVFVMRLIRFQGLVIERVGILLIIMTTLFQALFISNHLWALATLVARVYNRRAKQHHHFVIPVALVILGLFALIANQQEADWINRSLLSPLSWLYLVIQPCVILLCALFRGVRTQPGDNTENSRA